MQLFIRKYNRICNFLLTLHVTNFNSDTNDNYKA